MEGKIKQIGDIFYVLGVDNVGPGDLVINGDDILQVNQSTCVFYNEKVIGTTKVNVSDGDSVEIRFKCGKGKDCNYPFCNGSCGGNKDFYLLGIEERGY